MQLAFFGFLLNFINHIFCDTAEYKMVNAIINNYYKYLFDIYKKKSYTGKSRILICV